MSSVSYVDLPLPPIQSLVREIPGTVCLEESLPFSVRCEVKGIEITIRDKSIYPIIDQFEDWSGTGLKLLAPSRRLLLEAHTHDSFVRQFPEATTLYHIVYPLPHSMEPTRLHFVRSTQGDPLSRLKRYFNPKREFRFGTGSRTLTSLMIPPDVQFLATETVRQFVSQGFRFDASPLFQSEFGLVESVGDNGKSIHQARLHLTNSRLNDKLQGLLLRRANPLEPEIQLYVGGLTTVTTNPFAVVGTLSAGSDTHLTTLSGRNIRLDTNVQHRIRSSESLATDLVGIEIAPRIESIGRTASLGLSLVTNIAGEFRGGIVAKGVW